MAGIKTTYYLAKNDAIIQVKWELIRNNLKNSFNNLTDSDLKYIKGRERDLIIRLQNKLGKTETEVRRLIADIFNVLS